MISQRKFRKQIDWTYFFSTLPQNSLKFYRGTNLNKINKNNNFYSDIQETSKSEIVIYRR